MYQAESVRAESLTTMTAFGRPNEKRSGKDIEIWNLEFGFLAVVMIDPTAAG